MVNSSVKREDNVEILVAKAKEGDRAAAGKIIEKYNYLIIKEAARYHIPAYEFEDIVQHGYLSVIKAINMYKLGSSSFNGYVINSIKNNFKDLLKGNIRHYREISDDTLLDINSGNYKFTVEDEIIAYDQVKILYKALDKLSEEEKEIIRRFYLKDESLKEIACDTNKGYYKVFREKEKALKKLKASIEEGGI